MKFSGHEWFALMYTPSKFRGQIRLFRLARASHVPSYNAVTVSRQNTLVADMTLECDEKNSDMSNVFKSLPRRFGSEIRRGAGERAVCVSLIDWVIHKGSINRTNKIWASDLIIFWMLRQEKVMGYNSRDSTQLVVIFHQEYPENCISFAKKRYY